MFDFDEEAKGSEPVVSVHAINADQLLVVSKFVKYATSGLAAATNLFIISVKESQSRNVVFASLFTVVGLHTLNLLSFIKPDRFNTVTIFGSL